MLLATGSDLFAQVWKHLEAGNMPAAEQLCRQILDSDPGHVKAHNCLGVALFQQRQFTQAEASFRQALSIQPNNGFAHHNLTSVLIVEHKDAEALEHGQRALELMPDYAKAWNNLAVICTQQGRFDQAMSCFDKAVRLQPDFADAHLSRARLCLLLGDFTQGLPEYEWRRRRPGEPWPGLPQPLWDRSALQGRTIFVFAEQGLGDTLQFIRYLDLVKQRGGQVIFECQSALLRILASVQGIDCLLAQGAALPPFDVQAPLLSLPGILHTCLTTIPAKVPYLRADADLVEYWRRQLEPLQAFKIGIAWQGNPVALRDPQRSFPLAEFARLADVAGIQLISLQKGKGTEQLQDLVGRLSILDLGTRLDERCGAFMDTAAVMMNLDLVISCDTAVAHLAGALGVPVWVPLPAVPDWRWLLQREDSPWYPTMRLFRQKSNGQWDDVFERLAAEVRSLLARRGGS